MADLEVEAISEETEPEAGSRLSAEEAVRAMLVTLPRLVSRAKRTPVPEQLRSLRLAPRHLSLLSCLIFDGPTSVKDLAARLEVAPTTVSLMVSDLQREGVVERRSDPDDRRRSIVSLTEDAARAPGTRGPAGVAPRRPAPPAGPPAPSAAVR
ncbi:MarR family transcriptional regulator [Streptomyces phaeochromogenes]|uniref:MarR family transcriptional regulator n=1 Tax=Streptomyces phaeochromogenes TaxID=1923 RepID=UPI0037215587